MADSVYIATPEAGLVGTHVWDGSAWVKTLGNSAGQVMIAQEAGEAWGDGIAGLDFVLPLDEEENQSMPLIAPMLYNGATLDRWRNNYGEVLLASAARTVSIGSGAQVNYNARGIMLFLDVTANPGGTENLALKLRARSPVGGSPIIVATFATLSQAANGKITCLIYPGAVETGAETNLHVQGIAVPRDYDILVTHSSTGSWTYSLEVCYIL